MQMREIKYGTTVLMVAARGGHTDIVHALLEKRADPNAQGMSGETALIVAAFQGHIQTVQALLSGKADPNIQGLSTVLPL